MEIMDLPCLAFSFPQKPCMVTTGVMVHHLSIICPDEPLEAFTWILCYNFYYWFKLDTENL